MNYHRLDILSAEEYLVILTVTAELAFSSCLSFQGRKPTYSKISSSSHIGGKGAHYFHRS
jgi:hypothetical protein